MIDIGQERSGGSRAGGVDSRESDPTAEREDQPDSWNRHILSLIDAAVRSFISKDPVRVPRSIQRDDSGIRYRLGSVAPSIFCPGYTSAMDDRMHLLPSLAKSLASILTITNSPTLQATPLEPREMFVELLQGMEDLEDSNQAPAPLKRALSSYLWRDATLHLRERRTSQSLTPLSHVASGRSQAEAASDLLEEMSELDQCQEGGLMYEESWLLNSSDETISEDGVLDDLFLEEFPFLDVSELEADRPVSSCSGYLPHQDQIDAPILQEDVYEGTSDYPTDDSQEDLQYAIGKYGHQNASRGDQLPLLESDYIISDDFKGVHSLHSSMGGDFALFEDCNIPLEVRNESISGECGVLEEGLQPDVTTTHPLSLLALPYNKADFDGVPGGLFSPHQSLQKAGTDLLFSDALIGVVGPDFIASSDSEGDGCSMKDEVMLDSSENVSRQSYDDFYSQLDSSPFEAELEKNNDMLN